MRHEQAIPMGKCPVDIWASEPFADGMPKEKEQVEKCKFIIEGFLNMSQEACLPLADVYTLAAR